MTLILKSSPEGMKGHGKILTFAVSSCEPVEKFTNLDLITGFDAILTGRQFQSEISVSGAHYPEPPSALYHESTLSRSFLFIFRNMFPAKTLLLRCTAFCANSPPRFSPLLFWRSQRSRNNNGSECNNWCRGAKTPGRNRRRSVLKINIYGKGLTPKVRMGDGGPSNGLLSVYMGLRP